ncbi:MAG: type IV secretory system conjugative DNA transfer family protein [Firmicutes bacterium]|nr:type IV secretory system conjugative DNA transfer family protein [Bacillota bacterium]
MRIRWPRWAGRPSPAWIATALWALMVAWVTTLAWFGAVPPLSLGVRLGLWVALASLGYPLGRGWPGVAAGALALAPLLWPSLRWAYGIAGAAWVLWAWRARKPSPERLFVGRRLCSGWPVYLPLEDRFLHVHVLGPTGSGKSSSVLYPWIVQDLANGHGLTLLEPKGDLARAAQKAALHFQRPLIWFDPEDPRCPHWNPLSGAAEAAGEGLDWALGQLQEPGHPYYAAVSRVMLLYAVRAVKQALGPAADLPALLTFLRNPDYRRELLRQADAQVAEYFGEQWARLKPERQAEQQGGLVHRLELLLANPHLRRVLLPPQDFDWDQVLHQGWTVLAPLSLSRLGASARALGVLAWHGLMQATYRRGFEAAPYFLYLDEFHQYVSPDLSDFLALARGFRVGIVLAHQDLGQLSAPLRAALAANARQRLALGGLSPEDARWLEEACRPHPLPYSPRYLPRGQAILQRTWRGRLLRPERIGLMRHALSGEGG